MNQFSITAMREHCDAVTANGRELIIRWNGGGDDGCVSWNLDGDEIYSVTDLEQAILDRVQDELGYYSFAGNFSCEGEAVYDPDQKAFIGEDNNSATDARTTSCDIPMSLPEDLWFDQLVISLTTADDAPAVIVQFDVGIKNGPYPYWFDDELDELRSRLSAAFTDETRTLQGYDGAFGSLRLTRDDFTHDAGKLHYSFKEFLYSCCYEQTHSVFISFEEAAITN